jgi:integrase
MRRERSHTHVHAGMYKRRYIDANDPYTTSPLHDRVTKQQRLSSIDQFIIDHRNRNTQAAYASSWCQFIRWVREVENRARVHTDAVDTERPEEGDIAAYMQYLVTVRHAAMSTVVLALASINDHIRYSITHTYNPCNSARVQRMKAVLLPMTTTPIPKKAISWSMLKQIHAATTRVVRHRHLALRDTCMFMLAYFAYLRTSEIARMNRGDISFITSDTTGGGLIMIVHVNRMCKNDTKREGHNRMIEQRIDDGSDDDRHCMVSQMCHYLSLSPSLSPSSPLFVTNQHQRLSNDTPRTRLKHWMSNIGVSDIPQYGFHSLRAGGATDAANAGIDERHIKAHGNWKSDAVRGYMQPGQRERLIASSALGDR